MAHGEQRRVPSETDRVRAAGPCFQPLARHRRRLTSRCSGAAQLRGFPDVDLGLPWIQRLPSEPLVRYKPILGDFPAAPSRRCCRPGRYHVRRRRIVRIRSAPVRKIGDHDDSLARSGWPAGPNQHPLAMVKVHVHELCLIHGQCRMTSAQPHQSAYIRRDTLPFWPVLPMRQMSVLDAQVVNQLKTGPAKEK